ncbi:MAG: SDR family oxidoreductase [Pirellulaceae bacterium]|jgi:NAD(P)-dependent dehydrogenase (short-subunit alcohol dehydrogenase family)|nr:SDR family oxidoreductase [Pirellulaceae bacterium]
MSYWTDKVALVTGGSAGLGLAVARALAERGAHVAIAARDEARLRQATDLLLAHGQPCLGLAADVTRDADCQSLVAQTLEHFGRLDAVVHCAGRSARGSVADTTAADFAELLEINFLSAVRVSQSALAPLRLSRGHLVLIGSLASHAAAKHLGPYPASKFPLAAYAQQLRLELGPEGLHSLLVCPGPIRRDDAGTRYDQQAGGLPAAARQPGGGVRLKGIDPNWLAARILRACERREKEIVVPARARLLFAIGALWPTLGDWIVNRMTKG